MPVCRHSYYPFEFPISFNYQPHDQQGNNERYANILVCPLKCSTYGTTANKCPKFFSYGPTEENYALVLYGSKDYIAPLIIQLCYIKARIHTLAEFENI